jgi:hypothetical protein
MICGKEMQAVREKIVGAVREAVLGFASDDAGFEQEGEVAVEGDLSEANDDTDSGKGLNLAGQVGCAVANLLGKRLIARRGAANDGGDPGLTKLEAVVAGDGAGFRGEA